MGMVVQLTSSLCANSVVTVAIALVFRSAEGYYLLVAIRQYRNADEAVMTHRNTESVLYVVITYVVTYACWGSLALLQIPATSTVVSTVFYMLGGLATTLVALILPLFANRADRSSYYRRYFNLKIPLKWYLIPILPTVCAVSLSYGAMRVLHPQSLQGLTIQPLYMLFPLFFMMIFGGGLEELGWRGVLVHNLREINPIFISVAVGIVWACWHIPLFFVKGVLQYHTPFLPFLISVVAYSFITTPLYLKSGSVIPCIIAHALINAFGNLGFWYGSDRAATYIDSGAKLIIAVAFFAVIQRLRPFPKDYEVSADHSQ